MLKFIKLSIVFGIALLFASCAVSMSPSEVNNTLPKLTKSQFLSQTEAEELIKENRGRYLIKGREYAAPMGLTITNDLKNGAKGIDEWVQLDGGNAYVLTSYKWITVDHLGSTQLHIEFDTFLYE